MLTAKQIEWAKSHDWYVSDDGCSVIAEEVSVWPVGKLTEASNYATARGGWVQHRHGYTGDHPWLTVCHLRYTDFNELRKEAGY